MNEARELLKEVLKVLEWNGIMGSHDTYNSIKELLAQPEQEPVAWVNQTGDVLSNYWKQNGGTSSEEYSIPLYLKN